MGAHWRWGRLAGATLWRGATFQQVGIVYPPAGKAGFTTGPYVVRGPIFGLTVRQPSVPATWVGPGPAAAGLERMERIERGIWGSIAARAHAGVPSVTAAYALRVVAQRAGLLGHAGA